MINKVFTYGTLQKGCSNHGIINPQAIEKIEEAKVKDYDLYMHQSQRFPCMIPGNGTVVGQLITIKEEYLEETIKSLDRLEGFNKDNLDSSLYHRLQSPCATSEDSEYISYVYIYNTLRNGVAQHILTGDFKAYIEKMKVVK